MEGCELLGENMMKHPVLLIVGLAIFSGLLSCGGGVGCGGEAVVPEIALPSRPAGFLADTAMVPVLIGDVA
ncbi:MAG: hypothetical protein ACI97A_002200 [Planctomycetota bacterium]